MHRLIKLFSATYSADHLATDRIAAIEAFSAAYSAGHYKHSLDLLELTSSSVINNEITN